MPKQKKLVEIIRATTRQTFTDIELGGKSVPFPHNGRILTDDTIAANEARSQYGGDIVVVETDAREPGNRPPGTRRYWSVPEMPWKKDKPNGSNQQG
jgi:hypothetical protein